MSTHHPGLGVTVEVLAHPDGTDALVRLILCDCDEQDAHEHTEVLLSPLEARRLARGLLLAWARSDELARTQPSTVPPV